MFHTEVVEEIKTDNLCSVMFFKNRVDYQIMWKNPVGRGRAQMTIWLMRIACWIPNATNTHSGFLMLIAFPLQQWLHERASILRPTLRVLLILR